MDKWILYILRCADGSLYTGITTDLKNRVKKHNAGKASKYTRVKRPVKVVHRENFTDKSPALRREIEIKKLSRQDKLKLIE